MPAVSHKVDLPGSNCSSLRVVAGIASGDPAIAAIDGLLEEGWGQASYSRNGSQHVVIFRSIPDDDGVRYSVLWVADEDLDAVKPVGQPWAALELVYKSVVEVDVQCSLVSAYESMEPKLKLPLTPFADSLFPFNEIHGYRVAYVDNSHTEWSVIVDRPNNEGDYSMLMNLSDHPVDELTSSKALLQRCVAICDSLMMERENV